MGDEDYFHRINNITNHLFYKRCTYFFIPSLALTCFNKIPLSMKSDLNVAEMEQFKYFCGCMHRNHYWINGLFTMNIKKFDPDYVAFEGSKGDNFICPCNPDFSFFLSNSNNVCKDEYSLTNSGTSSRGIHAMKNKILAS